VRDLVGHNGLDLRLCQVGGEKDGLTPTNFLPPFVNEREFAVFMFTTVSAGGCKPRPRLTASSESLKSLNLFHVVLAYFGCDGRELVPDLEQ